MKKELLNITVSLTILFSTIVVVHAQTAPKVVKEIFDVSPGGQLMIDSDLGSIDVKTSIPNKVEIVVTKETEKLDRLLDPLKFQEPFTDIDVTELLNDFKFTFEQKGHNVHITGKFKTGREHLQKKLLLLSLLKIHFEVTIPHRYSVNLNTTNDGISVVDLAGGVRVQTSGDLRIGEIKGPVWGRTSSSGNIILEGCQGNVDVQASIGDIDLGNVVGDVKAKTGSSGNITLKVCQGNVDLTTSIGDINLGDVAGYVRANGGDIQIGNVGGEVIAQASSSGNIILEGCQGNVDVQASIGDIDLGSVWGSVKATTGSSGRISLKKCESNVEVKASIGDVTLSNITGTVKARGGDIQISNVGGEVMAQASSSGDITLKGCQDNVDVQASIGDIDLTNITGTAKAKTGSSGTIQVTNVGGAVQAEASIGNLYFSDVKGSVWGRTGSSGNITLKNCQGGVDVMTSIGDIRAEVTSQLSRQWTVETSGSGEITAILSPQIAINIDAQTNRGSISSDFLVQGSEAKNSLKGTINGGGPLVKLRASSGNIRLQRK